MSRMNAGDLSVQKPQNNVYTVLAIVGTLAVILSLVVMYMRGQSVFPMGAGQSNWLF